MSRVTGQVCKRNAEPLTHSSPASTHCRLGHPNTHHGVRPVLTPAAPSLWGALGTPSLSPGGWANLEALRGMAQGLEPVCPTGWGPSLHVCPTREGRQRSMDQHSRGPVLSPLQEGTVAVPSHSRWLSSPEMAMTLQEEGTPDGPANQDGHGLPLPFYSWARDPRGPRWTWVEFAGLGATGLFPDGLTAGAGRGPQQ